MNSKDLYQCMNEFAKDRDFAATMSAVLTWIEDTIMANTDSEGNLKK